MHAVYNRYQSHTGLIADATDWQIVK